MPGDRVAWHGSRRAKMAFRAARWASAASCLLQLITAAACAAVGEWQEAFAFSGKAALYAALSDYFRIKGADDAA